MKKIIFTLAAISLLGAQGVLACEVTALPYGKDFNEVTKQYRLPALAPGEGTELTVPTRASKICPGLDRKVKAQLQFMNNKLHSLILVSHQSFDALSKVAEANFGPADRERNPWNPDKSTFQSVWDAEKFSVMHTFDRAGSRSEVLKVTYKHNENTDKAFRHVDGEEE